MNVIVIDDEPAPLLTFASHILDNAAVTANMFSLKVDEALEFALAYIASAFHHRAGPPLNRFDAIGGFGFGG